MKKQPCFTCLEDPKEWYLCKNPRFNNRELHSTLVPEQFRLYEVLSMKEEQSLEYLDNYENLLDSLQLENLVIIYIIYGELGNTRYFYGLTIDHSKEENNSSDPSFLERLGEGEEVFLAAFEAYFPSAVINTVPIDERRVLLERLQRFTRAGILEGVPGVDLGTGNVKMTGNEGVSKIMKQDAFMVVRLARALSVSEICSCENQVQKLCNLLGPLVATTISYSSSQNNSNSFGINAGNQSACNKSWNHSDSRKEQKIDGEADLEEELTPEIDGDFFITAKERQKSLSHGSNQGNSCNQTLANSFLCSNSTTKTRSVISVNLLAKGWMDYANTVVSPRIDYGKSRGLYLVTTGIFGESRASLVKLECNTKRDCSCGGYNKIPIRRMELPVEDQRISCIQNFQFPHYCNKQWGNSGKQDLFSKDELAIRSGFCQLVNENFAYGGNYVSSKELKKMIALPAFYGL